MRVLKTDTSKYRHNILNLGAGVQSTAIALMSFEGVLPRFDCAYFADTGWEPARVYEHLEWLKGEFEMAGVPLTVLPIRSNLRDDAIHCQKYGGKLESGRWGSMPMFVLNPDGTHGMIRRQCTSEYKIKPIEKSIKADVLKIAPKKHWPKEPVVLRWYGISLDEVQRMRTSDQKWAVNYYPLIENRFDRTACMKWMHDRGYPEPPRSACIGCPFHSDREWAEMSRDRPDEFEDACIFDEEIRACYGMKGKIFLHRSRKPLREVNFDTGQLSLWSDECSGVCGV